MAVRFFNEETTFTLKAKQATKRWIKGVIEIHNRKAGDINIIFCTDNYLHDINVTYLKHDTFTDIITFDNSEDEIKIDADIFISIERVKENATTQLIDEHEEMLRVIIHGILHLIGFGDKTDAEKKAMRVKENECLSLLLKN